MHEESSETQHVLLPSAGPLVYAIACTLAVPIFLILIVIVMTVTWGFVPFVAYYQRKAQQSGTSPDSKVSLLNENQSDID